MKLSKPFDHLHLSTTDLRDTADDAERELCKRSLAAFVRRAWHVVEPGQAYVHGPHIDVVCRALEAITEGRTTRLLINVPPGTMKSLLVNVFWPMWEWGPRGLAHLRTVGVSHEQGLGVRDNLKCRRLLLSEWFQGLWPGVRLRADQSEKIKFENTSTGFREVATPSNITGRRGDRVVVDDPLSAENANSEAEREKVNLWFREALPTRLNNPDGSAIVIVMQRLHARDVSGVALAMGGWDSLILPMRFEPDRADPKDWRTRPGELLMPARFTEQAVERLEGSMGSYAVAGQLQQRPVPREGGLFKRAWFAGNIITKDRVPAVLRRCRGWDFAASTDKPGADPDWTASILLARSGPDYYVLGADRMRATAGEVQMTVRQRAELDPVGTIIRIPQDPGQAGKAQVQSYVTSLAGFTVRPVVTSGRGDKARRAEPLAIQAEYGHLWFVNSGSPDEGVDPWITTLIDELCDFPSGRHDDQVDAISEAFDDLAQGRVIEFDFASTGKRMSVQPHGDDPESDNEDTGVGFGSRGSGLWGISH